jgi:hypothetical protein
MFIPARTGSARATSDRRMHPPSRRRSRRSAQCDHEREKLEGYYQHLVWLYGSSGSTGRRRARIAGLGNRQLTETGGASLVMIDFRTIQN